MSGDSSSAPSTVIFEVLTKLALRHLSRLSTFQDGRPLDGIWSYTVKRSPTLFSFTMRGISRYRSLPAFVKGRRTPFLEATGASDCVNSFLTAWNKKPKQTGREDCPCCLFGFTNTQQTEGQGPGPLFRQMGR